MVKVVIADAVHKTASELIINAGFELIDVSENREKLASVISDADALIVRSATKVRGELLESARKLKIVGRAGVGLDNIDLDECTRREITVVNSPEGPTRSVAEIALALLISVARNLGSANIGTKSGDWPKKNKGIELYGRTLGIIGSGAIGGTLAKYCIALGMQVKAYDIIEIPELSKMEHFEYVKLDDLLKTSDFISLHVPLVPATKHMINGDAFSKMKERVIIINCARGGVIDEDALLIALNSGKVAGAALDVYEVEPVDHRRKLIQHPNLIATPHIGAQTHDASKNNTVIVCNKIIDHFKK